MTRYRVEVECRFMWTGTVDVDANNEREARLRAASLAEEHSTEIDWDWRENGDEEFDVTSVEEVGE